MIPFNLGKKNTGGLLHTCMPSMKKFRLKLCPLNTYLFVTVIRIELQQYDRMAMVASFAALTAMMDCVVALTKGVSILQQKKRAPSPLKKQGSSKYKKRIYYPLRSIKVQEGNASMRSVSKKESDRKDDREPVSEAKTVPVVVQMFLSRQAFVQHGAWHRHGYKWLPGDNETGQGREGHRVPSAFSF